MAIGSFDGISNRLVGTKLVATALLDLPGGEQQRYNLPTAEIIHAN